LQLRSAIAAQAKQAIAGKAFTMDPTQHRFIAGYVAADKRDMLFARTLIFEPVQSKWPPLRGKLGGCYKLY